MRFTITKEDLEKLRYIGSGAFGAVYTDEDITIKKYHSLVKTDLGNLVRNPCLKLQKRKFHRLNERDKKIQYTDTAVDEVYIDGEFSGVKKKYYDGQVLQKFGSCPLTVKKQYLRELVRNAKELSKNKIYYFDYKANNVIVTRQGQIKIIDLDDSYTKATLFQNLHYRGVSLRKLRDMAVDFLYDHQLDFPESVIDKIENNPKKDMKDVWTISYEKLDTYIRDFKVEDRILVLDMANVKELDLNFIKEMIDKNQLVVVLGCRRKITRFDYNSDLVKECIDYLKAHGIAVYDLFLIEEKETLEEKLEDYIVAHETDEVFSYDSDKKELQKRKIY